MSQRGDAADRCEVVFAIAPVEVELSTIIGDTTIGYFTTEIAKHGIATRSPNGERVNDPSQRAGELEAEFAFYLFEMGYEYLRYTNAIRQRIGVEVVIVDFSSGQPRIIRGRVSRLSDSSRGLIIEKLNQKEVLLEDIEKLEVYVKNSQFEGIGLSTPELIRAYRKVLDLIYLKLARQGYEVQSGMKLTEQKMFLKRILEGEGLAFLEGFIGNVAYVESFGQILVARLQHVSLKLDKEYDYTGGFVEFHFMSEKGQLIVKRISIEDGELVNTTRLGKEGQNAFVLTDITSDKNSAAASEGVPVHTLAPYSSMQIRVVRGLDYAASLFEPKINRDTPNKLDVYPNLFRKGGIYLIRYSFVQGDAARIGVIEGAFVGFRVRLIEQSKIEVVIGGQRPILEIPGSGIQTVHVQNIESD